MKIGFTRAFALEVLGYESDDESDPDFPKLSNEELSGELCLSGWIHDEDMAGVFDTLPKDIIDAEVQSDKTGWPVSQ